MIFVLQVLQLVFAMLGVAYTIAFIFWKLKQEPKIKAARAMLDLAKREQNLWIAHAISNPKKAEEHKQYMEIAYQKYQELAKVAGIE